MSNMMQYTIASIAFGWAADFLGAGMMLSFMAAVIGPPLAKIGYLLLTQNS